MRTFTAYIEFDPETKLYVGTVPGLVGAHTQAPTLTKLQENLAEVLQLCLEEYKGDIEDLPQFVGIQQIQIADPATR
jgi:predicted RNase H-like HicB family nuclease